MLFLSKPIGYLTNSDFDDNGNLILKGKSQNNQICIIMIQASFCGYCKMALPTYQQLADSNTNPNIFYATIHGDGKEKGEAELNARIKVIDKTFRGYPSFIAYKDGKYVKSYSGDRSLDSLKKFVDSI